jgi:hypothetical protein
MALQIKGKFLASDAVDAEKVKLRQGQAIRAIDQNGNEIELVKVDASGRVVGNGHVLAKLSEVQDEQQRATGAEQGLTESLNQEIQDRLAGDSTTLQSARTYTDTQIQNLIGTAPGVLDTLGEISAALSNDQSVSVALTTQISNLSNGLTEEIANRAADVDAEEARALAAEGQLDGRLDVLEARSFYKKKFIITNQDILNGYVELDHQAMPRSIVASIGRLMIHEGNNTPGQEEDFYVSVSSGKSRLCFQGNLVAPSPEELAAEDVLYVKYYA